MKIIVTRAGFLTSVQDLGRSGYRQFGVSLGGALDAFALRVANLLVGNNESAAGLEITFGGLQLRFADERVVAWCGGEFDVRSGSTDLRASYGGLEGRVLRDGDILLLGARPGSSTLAITGIGSWTGPHDWVSPAKRDPMLRFVRGADWARFNASTLQRFTSESFAVSPDSDRMGVRLDGPELQRENNVDLISEAVAPGAIQVPPSGQPILLLGDCQTIGGYP